MGRVTNEHLHTDVKLAKQELSHLKEGQIKMLEDLTMIKKTLLGPDNGTISRVNKNTEFRKMTGRVLWSIWVVLIGIIGKILFWN